MKASGFLLVAHLADGVKKAYMFHDKMFDGVVGYQHDTSFITRELYEQMKTKLNLTSGSDEYKFVDTYPCDEENMNLFLYNFAYMCCKHEAVDGEVPQAVHSFKHIF